MVIRENVDLLAFNTFAIAAHARYFTVIRSVDEAISCFRSAEFQKNRSLILGGGSNLLLTGDFDGLVVKNELKGIEVVAETAESITLKVGAGENWHGLVMYAVDRDYGGIENLSLIPGTVGAAPMQNIGAYGVEVKEVVDSVEAIELASGRIVTFSNAACRFGYRESIFKQEKKDQYFISSITLTLTKKNHRLHVEYGAIREVLAQQPDLEITVKRVSDAVISIRQSKLPDPKVLGNAGSFFKNPSVQEKTFEEVKRNFPDVPRFAGEHGLIKIPAAWMIEKCGWKGKTFENIGVHKHQALVLVNYGGGNGKKIFELATNIQQSVLEKFGIKLQPEVNIL